MSDSVRDLLVRGVAAAKVGEKAEARYYLNWALRLDPTAEQCITAWLWLSRISDDPAEKRNYLEEVLAVNITHPEARRELALLEGRLKAEDIVDPNRYVATAPDKPQPAQARQFVCPRCGGRMVYNPQGQLTCEYCERRQAMLTPTVGSRDIEEHDFVLALATAKGHASPIAVRCVRCQGCGASFSAPPESLSFTCPYCAAAYSIEQVEEQELIPPTAIIPFTMDRATAERVIARWIFEERIVPTQVTPLAGIYFPAWTFDIWCTPAGSCKGYTDTLRVEDVAVPASRKLGESLADEVERFDLGAQVAYDPRYLAGWPAEMYQVSPADASLVARQKVIARVRGIQGGVEQKLSLHVISFKLILLPLWIARYRDKRGEYTVIVNGQTGTLRTDRSERNAGVGGLR